MGAMPLVPQMADALRPVPVVAAGGIADGRGVIAALALGAAGVQMGTAFLGCPEANIHPAYRRAVLGGTAAVGGLVAWRRTCRDPVRDG